MIASDVDGRSYDVRSVHGTSTESLQDTAVSALERCSLLVICGSDIDVDTLGHSGGPSSVGPPRHLGRRGAGLASRLGVFRVLVVEAYDRAEWEAN